ncbi:MAG: MarR family transcriptional regulator [Clostridia bacterium]|nr:MarR family transcriptional regulator [Clostridia bacterium]
MNKEDIMNKQKFIFSQLFLLSNKLQVMGDRVLTGEMTIHQWLLTVAIAQFGDIPPLRCEVADFMESSHQNVKQLALKLQRKGFINIEKDKEDLRAIRLILTEKSIVFWKSRQTEVK